ncbi:MAG: hypothetical protein IPK31_09090 [Chitinophagaceae bacterium]|nr:hypothetical protein [Chitinophagaceae bacterium]
MRKKKKPRYKTGLPYYQAYSASGFFFSKIRLSKYEIKKLTIAPTAANTAVFSKSAECILASTMRIVPLAVPVFK